ncbi:dual specificity protein phosphatase 22-B isoform X2 [Nothobranchius furzeri]|uniref:Dual specificity phosphatase 22 n=1 Tax=Nothobranchius furzeri TaxID=105023 RepID=A0A8C6L6B1_NOTFU|nr:dual specificity protein phosphatase 22-B isoform X6 [Nothobranchius furzeri]KAF7202868.1 transcript variant X1 [Nothobranchius furzeri]
MGNGITKILPDLYLGNLKDARDRELLARHNITHILSIHDTASPVLEEMTYLCIPAADHSKQNLIQFFKESIEFIHESRLKGEGCLVHCVAGVSRSVTLVVAYIMTVTGRGWVQALGAVRAARPCAGPNLGFLRQLEEFQNTELAQYRAWWSERFGKSPFSDDDEIQNLLNHKSANGRSATDTATAADLGTAGT